MGTFVVALLALGVIAFVVGLRTPSATPLAVSEEPVYVRQLRERGVPMWNPDEQPMPPAEGPFALTEEAHDKLRAKDYMLVRELLVALENVPGLRYIAADALRRHTGEGAKLRPLDLAELRAALTYSVDFCEGFVPAACWDKLRAARDYREELRQLDDTMCRRGFLVARAQSHDDEHGYPVYYREVSTGRDFVHQVDGETYWVVATRQTACGKDYVVTARSEIPADELARRTFPATFAVNAT
jgi:hypothetical protein